ncbi:High-affinity branched-chain amino acid transport ATP-binding protein LivF [Thermoflexales bacterium]|nr:High-affinity branched-chain amino acid transport ATP-binding protein LivF [Thermoflexales bacterium]
MLHIEKVAAAYGDVQALWDVSLDVQVNEIVVLIGPNGAGKTTLMRTIAGLHRPRSGRILFEGTALHTVAAHQIVERGIILVPEGRRLFEGMTVLENLQLGAYTRRAKQQRDKTLRHVLDIFPLLAERRHDRASSLSGGQQQMLAIGRALMGLPRLLMLDEPSLGLAPLIVRHIFEIVKSIKEEGVTVLLVEQNARRALELAHRAYILEQGRIVGTGSGSDLLHNDEVREAYLGYAPVTARTLT